MMFKILLLQTWYGLSDYEVEERINDSLLFSEFLLLIWAFQLQTTAPSVASVLN